MNNNSDDPLKRFIITILAVIIILAPKNIEADKLEIIEVDKYKEVIENIIMCESGGDHTVIGDKDYIYQAHGILQYQKRTFEYLKKLANMTELNIESEEDQITLFKWSLSNGYGEYWTCVRTLYPELVKS